MAALNIANDLLRERKTPRAGAPNADVAGVQRRIQTMQMAIDQALAGQEKLF